MSNKKKSLFSSSGSVELGIPLIMEVNTQDVSSAVSDSDTIILPFVRNNTVNLQIDWGDGSELEPYTNTLFISHQYSVGGFYDIKIYNLNGVSRIPWNITTLTSNKRDYSKFYDLKQFGDCEIYQLDDLDEGSFNDCINLDITATDIGERCVELCVNSKFLFRNCSIVEAKNSNNWDTSNITDFFQTFRGNNSIIIDCSNWEMSQVLGIRGVFNGCGNLNPDVTNWDISSNCIDIVSAFANLIFFNRNLSNWDVSAVEEMETSFINCNSFTGQGLDTWVTLAVKNLSRTFENCFNFNQDLSGWDFSNVLLMGNFGFNWGMDTNNYDKLLLSLSTQSLKSNLTTVRMSSKYTAGEVTNGVTDSIATNKLIDSTQVFTSSVNVGDVIKNGTTYAEVVTVDSNTELTLDLDIMALGDSYSVEGSNVAKARYFVVKTYNWEIIDDGQALNVNARYLYSVYDFEQNGNDSKGNNNGTVIGGSYISESWAINDYVLDMTNVPNGRFEIPYSTDFNLSQFTISAKYTTRFIGTTRFLWVKQGVLGIKIRFDRKIEVGIADNPGVDVLRFVFDWNFQNSQEGNLIMTYDGGSDASSFKAFIDNVQVPVTDESTGNFTSINTNTNPMQFGLDGDNLRSAVDSMCFWSVPLSLSEINDVNFVYDNNLDITQI